MIHYIKVDCGDGSSCLWFFSTKELAYKYAEHPDNEDSCNDGDGITYGTIDAIPGPSFKFDDDSVEELYNG